jgi:ribose transport system substrate-binding protein
MALRRLVTMVGLLAVLTSGVACGRSQSRAAATSTADSTPRRIAVIPKGTTHEFWKSIHAGAVKAARAGGAEIIWKGPVREDDRDEQIKVVETFLGEHVDGIVLAPLDDHALVPVLKDAEARHVPVVIVDSPVDWDGYVTFVATDNAKAGGLAADRLGAVLGGKGRVIMMRYEEGSASTMARESGFMAELAAKFPAITVVSSNQYGGATTETAYATAEKLLSTYNTSDGIYCPNESTTFGMLRALEGAGRAGHVRFVGFDATAKLVEGLSAGTIDGLVMQNPMVMGEQSVALLLSSLKGGTVPRRVDTGATLVTKDNMNQPEVKALLAPDLAPYLN